MGANGERHSDRSRHTWYCWCEAEDCDWELEITNRSNERAQNITSTRMITHGLEEGHYETRRKELGDDDE